MPPSSDLGANHIPPAGAALLVTIRSARTPETSPQAFLTSCLCVLLQLRGSVKALLSPVEHCQGFLLSPECNPDSFPGITGPVGPDPSAAPLGLSGTLQGGCLLIPCMLKLSPPQDSALTVPSTQNSLPPSLHVPLSVIHISLDSITSAWPSCLPQQHNLPSA